MKNTKKVSEHSAIRTLFGQSMPIYYNIKEDAVYTSDGEGRYYITDLIRPNTEKEVIATVRKNMGM